jgi:trehalose 6-phosphate synthase
LRFLSIRLIVSLILGITLVTLGFSWKEVSAQKQGLRSDLERHAEETADSLASNLEPYVESGSTRQIQRAVKRFDSLQHANGAAVYDKQGLPIAITPGFTDRLSSGPAIAASAIAADRASGEFVHVGNLLLHVYAVPLHSQNSAVDALVIVHDASYIRTQGARVWRETFIRVLVQVFLIVLITVLIVRWSIVGPIAQAAQWMRALRTGKGSFPPGTPSLDLLRPLAREIETMAKSLRTARSAAAKEAQLRDAAESIWTAERLSAYVGSRLGDQRLFVVSNREPYAHTRKGKSLEVVVPPSGLVTALEPILYACDGTWIAHGSGDADREVVDKHDRLRVPPEDPRYTLRRVWLSKEQEEGYYFGFANEGLWPLCHIAHARPIFRASDWAHYVAVNQQFADTVVEEMADTESPLLLAQDYHFALLPRLVKQKRPDARVAIFWHIPWPNPEMFSICPYQRELMNGLLGADLVSFHIQQHCNNFLESVDRTLESRVDWDRFTVTREEHRTVVKPFPISVPWEEPSSEDTGASAYDDRVALLRELGVNASLLGVGVDRVDYTKGILERFLAVERLLERYPAYRGKFSFIQIGAPSRTHIKRYHDLLGEVEAEADRINWRFQDSSWKPIILLQSQHSHREIQRYYKVADICMVTSLHDGMNLVAKEFLAARSDEQGVLILSQFTGAARELRDALIVNPYDTEQVAESLRFALEMPAEERQARMQRMRKNIKENNVYGWAANLITELSDLRLASDRAEQPSEQWNLAPKEAAPYAERLKNTPAREVG